MWNQQQLHHLLSLASNLPSTPSLSHRPSETEVAFIRPPLRRVSLQLFFQCNDTHSTGVCSDVCTDARAYTRNLPQHLAHGDNDDDDEGGSHTLKRAAGGSCVQAAVRPRRAPQDGPRPVLARKPGKDGGW